MVVKREKPSHRERQAQATRAQVARAARALFAERGYVGTTITAISEAADIPAPTIYSAFGNKAAILAEVSRMWIAEADTPRLAAQAIANPDPVERLRMAAHFQRRQCEVGYDVIMIYQEAARTDPQMAQEFHNVLASREREIRKLIDSLTGHLAAGLTPARAVDLYVTCGLPEIYRTLVLERGWSLHRYEEWLADLLITQLLQPPTTT